MSIVVQFVHPGVEEVPDRLAKHSRNFLPVSNNPGFYQRNWTVGKHGRKFLQDKGNYVDVLNSNQYVTDADLCFWCEAEWNTMARSLVQPPNGAVTSEYPNWLHCFYPVPPAFTPPFGQNTDPYVFGPQFIYSNCRQNTALQGVSFNAGDLILFGSMKSDFNTPRFMLDTVFVVGNDPVCSVNPLKSIPNIRTECGKRITDNFEETVLKPLKTGIPCSGCQPVTNFTIYFGASYTNQWNGIYSFVPIKVPGLTNQQNGDSGYERLTFTAQNIPQSLSQYIDLNLNPQRGINKTTVNSATNTTQVWQDLVDFAKLQGYVLGTYFKEP